MSDRVFFATNETAGFWPNISGFSGFPFPVAGSGFPTSLTKAQQIELFWRVRIFDITIETYPDPLEFYGPFRIYAHDATYGNEPISEKYLCLHQSADWYGRDESDGMEMQIAFGADDTAQFSLHVFGFDFVVSDQAWSDGIHFIGDGYDYFVQPSEYWPYANSVGAPIYNTATGAQINDPLS